MIAASSASFFSLISILRSDWFVFYNCASPNQQNVFRIKIFTDGINAWENICFIKACGFVMLLFQV
jgi:hypothetical protein